MSYKRILKNIANQTESCSSKRHDWISVAAYYKAEARDFKPGKELDDWLEAETDYIDFKIKKFLHQTLEDGGITVSGLQQLAHTIGVDNAKHIIDEKELVRQIQKASQHRPCFRSENNLLCKELECKWHSECKKLIAEWKSL